jgi:hypothetical protein
MEVTIANLHVFVEVRIAMRSCGSIVGSIVTCSILKTSKSERSRSLEMLKYSQLSSLARGSLVVLSISDNMADYLLLLRCREQLLSSDSSWP